MQISTEWKVNEICYSWLLQLHLDTSNSYDAVTMFLKHPYDYQVFFWLTRIYGYVERKDYEHM